MVSALLSSLAASLAMVKRKSESRFRYLRVSGSTSPAATNGVTCRSARRQTDREMWRLEEVWPPENTIEKHCILGGN